MGLNFFVIRHQWRKMDYQQASQDQHFLASETDGCTFTDYRPLQAHAGRVRQNELLVNVQEAENGFDSLWHR